MSCKDKKDRPPSITNLDRRKLLLGGSALVAAAALISDATAQAQTPAPAIGSKRPNIWFSGAMTLAGGTSAPTTTA